MSLAGDLVATGISAIRHLYFSEPKQLWPSFQHMCGANAVFLLSNGECVFKVIGKITTNMSCIERSVWAW